VTRAVLFDLGDTLFRLNAFDHERVKARFAASLCERMMLGEPEALTATASLYEEFSEALRLSYQEGRTAEVTVAAHVATSLSAFGGEREWLGNELDQHFGETDTARWELPPGRAELLEALLSRGLRIGFVSNTLTSAALMDARLHEFGLRDFAEVAVYSVAVGHRKPSPLIYRRALEALDMEPADVAFVGDRVREDVRGPQSVGMRGILTHEFRQEPADDGGEPFPVIQRLDEVINHLG
jgi:putative hydrolase of the HAD superfamily